MEQTLRREIAEEVGVQIDGALHYVDSTAFVADDGEPVVDVVFFCRYRSGAAQPVATGEVAGVTWMTAAEVLADTSTPPWTHRSIELAERLRTMQR